MLKAVLYTEPKLTMKGVVLVKLIWNTIEHIPERSDLLRGRTLLHTKIYI